MIRKARVIEPGRQKYSSSVKCVDVCVEFDDNNTTKLQIASVAPPDLIKRVRKRLRTGVCRRVLPLDVLKFHADEQKMKEYEFEDRDVQKVLARVFIRAAAGKRRRRGLDAFNAINNNS